MAAEPELKQARQLSPLSRGRCFVAENRTRERSSCAGLPNSLTFSQVCPLGRAGFVLPGCKRGIHEPAFWPSMAPESAASHLSHALRVGAPAMLAYDEAMRSARKELTRLIAVPMFSRAALISC